MQVYMTQFLQMFSIFFLAFYVFVCVVSQVVRRFVSPLCLRLRFIRLVLYDDG